ncbi:MAG: arylesterase [Vicinamibacterales bacterium]
METLMFHSRRRFAACGLLAVALLAGCDRNGAARTPDTPAATPPNTPAAAPSDAKARAAARPRIVFLGDSLTAGLGLPQSQAFPAVIGEKLQGEGYDVQVVNAGISGDTAAGGRRRMNWALEGNVRVLVVALGANDGLRGNPVNAMKDSLAAIIRDAKARGIKVLLLGMEAPPNFGPEYTAEFRRAFRDLAEDEDVAFVPFFLEGVAGIPSLNQPDGLHPNTNGSRRIADTVWKALEPLAAEAVPRTSDAGQRR